MSSGMQMTVFTVLVNLVRRCCPMNLRTHFCPAHRHVRKSKLWNLRAEWSLAIQVACVQSIDPVTLPFNPYGRKRRSMRFARDQELSASSQLCCAQWKSSPWVWKVADRKFETYRLSVDNAMLRIRAVLLQKLLSISAFSCPIRPSRYQNTTSSSSSDALFHA